MLVYNLGPAGCSLFLGAELCFEIYKCKMPVVRDLCIGLGSGNSLSELKRNGRDEINGTKEEDTTVSYLYR